MATATKRAMVRKRARALICHCRRTVSLLVTCSLSSSERPPSAPSWAPPCVAPSASLPPPPPPPPRLGSTFRHQTVISNKFLSHGRSIYRIYHMRYCIYHICRMRSHLSHAISNLSHLSHEIMQAAPYSGTSSVRTISNDGCSTTFIVVDVAGEAADEAEEEASTVLPRHVVVVDTNQPPSPPPNNSAATTARKAVASLRRRGSM